MMGRNQKSPWLDPDTLTFTIVLGLLAALPALSIDISQPLLTTVEQELDGHSGLIGLTITVFMFGFALGQFCGGPLSDTYGRRPVLLGSLAAYVVAGVGCATAQSAMALLLFRFMQGTASGSCAVLAFTIIRDLFDGDAARAKRAYVIVALGIAPLLSPTIGAWILGWAGWRPVYLVLSTAGALLLASVAVGLGETRPVLGDMSRRRLTSGFVHVLSDRAFLALASLNALSYGAIFAYIAGSPQVLMGRLNFSGAEYGLFFACTAGALTVGAFVSGRCTKAGVGPRGMIWVSLLLGAASSVVLAVLLAMDIIGMGVLLPLLLITLFARGMTAPNAQHMALEPMREQAGSAAAAVGVMQIVTGAFSSAVVALLLPLLGPSAMSMVMAVLALASLMVWLWIARWPDLAQ